MAKGERGFFQRDHSWGQGFYGEQRNYQGSIFRWSKDHSKLFFKNFSDNNRIVSFEFDLASESSGKVVAYADGSRWELNSSTIPTHHKLTLLIDGNSSITLSFSANLSKVNAPNDVRDLFFYLLNPVIRDVTLREQS